MDETDATALDKGSQDYHLALANGRVLRVSAPRQPERDPMSGQLQVYAFVRVVATIAANDWLRSGACRPAARSGHCRGPAWLPRGGMVVLRESPPEPDVMASADPRRAYVVKRPRTKPVGQPDARLNGDGTVAAQQLRLYRPEELAEPPRKLRPLIRGVAARGTYGPFGGKQKTLKSYCAYGFALAVASGNPAFGFPAWAVPEAEPVLIFAGEGGIELTKRRLQRIASEVYEIETLKRIPLYVVAGAAGMESDEFEATLVGSIDTIRDDTRRPPSLLILDALYNFHPAGVEVSNIYERGRMLSTFEHLVHAHAGDDCVLWVVDHFRKAARGTDLDEYQQSGMAAWADTWFNMKHREGQESSLDENQFWLDIEIGSRQGYAGLYEIDMDLGPFDDETMEWDRPMRVEIRRVSQHTRSRRSGGASDEDIDRDILALIDSGGMYTKTEVKKTVTGNDSKVNARVNELLTAQQLTLRSIQRDEGGRIVTREIIQRAGKLRSASEPVPGTRSRAE